MGEQLIQLAKPFAPRLVMPAAQGKHGDYVNQAVVNQKLLTVLGPFDFHIVREIYDDGILTGIIGRLECEIDGRITSIEECGDVENPNVDKTNGARLKKASSDAFKRCASRIGVGLDLWSKPDYFLYDELKKEQS